MLDRSLAAEFESYRKTLSTEEARREKPDWNRSAGYALLQSHEPLPPYELDPMIDNLVIRKRIGELIQTQ